MSNKVVPNTIVAAGSIKNATRSISISFQRIEKAKASYAPWLKMNFEFGATAYVAKT